MNINPLDIIVTRSNEVLHVQEVISGDGSHDEEMVIKVKDHGGRSFTRTVTNPEREIRKCGSNVSVLDAEDYYDRERFMDTLVTESRSKDFKALHNYYYNYSSLVYCPSLLTDNSLSARSMYEYLDAAERDISEAISWMKDTRDEYLTKTTEISELADKAPTYTEPTLTGEAVSLYDVKFKVGGIYRYQFNPMIHATEKGNARMSKPIIEDITYREGVGFIVPEDTLREIIDAELVKSASYKLRLTDEFCYYRSEILRYYGYESGEDAVEAEIARIKSGQ